MSLEIQNIIKLLQSGEANSMELAYTFIECFDLFDFFINRYSQVSTKIKACGKVNLKEHLFELFQLNRMNFASANISNLEILKDFIRLADLSITNQDCQTLIFCEGDFPNLFYLSLECCYNVNTDGIHNLGKLERLRIRNSNLNVLSADVGNVNSLYELVLEGNSLTDLPKLCSVCFLNISNNNFAKIPDSVFEQPSIETLIATDNSITEISKDVKNLARLKMLKLSNNKIEELPDELFKLSCLSSLSLNNNKIENVPQSIQNLSSLSILHIQNNFISELPDSMYRLSKLLILYANENLLKTLPDLSNCKELAIVHLSKNSFEFIPDAIFKLKNLESCDLRQNPIRHLLGEFKTINCVLKNGAELLL